jgi:hypothetical protein
MFANYYLLAARIWVSQLESGSKICFPTDNRISDMLVNENAGFAFANHSLDVQP